MPDGLPFVCAGHLIEHLEVGVPAGQLVGRQVLLLGVCVEVGRVGRSADL